MAFKEDTTDGSYLMRIACLVYMTKNILIYLNFQHFCKCAFLLLLLFLL